ncbi:LytR C-terminal domain-containing protein [uncultured Treponema sp.]|uniref:LCP family protein n=1 Tax=uncultured Treponema sp. TaxID=162155 RepID=UPI000E90A320|nr:LytR C-terminal domain-containing protein [uncultured Treponema sp.]HAZ96350.1 LytR family transcriptional regulator [Treponema sp.]
MNISKDQRNGIFLLAILVIIIGVVGFVAFSLRVDPIEENLKLNPVINSLWILKDDEGNALSTDVLVFYPQTGQAAAFDILGNTGAIYKSLGRVDRIDSVYKEKGLASYKEEIEKLIGKKIPFTIEIKLSDLELITDYLGGLNVFISFPVDETDENGMRCLFPSGAVVLDGDKIHDYVMYKSPSENASDVEDRRQAVFVSLIYALKENRNIIFAKNNFSVYEEKIKTNIDKKNFYNLMKKISLIDTERFSIQTITGSLRTVDGQTLLFPYYDGQLIKDVINQAISSLVSGDSGNQNRVYVLVIQNGTTEQGLARNTSFLLQSAGYEVLETKNADRNDYEKTEIINHIGNSEAAKTLGNFIHCSNIIDEELMSENADSTSVAQADFTIILGKDFNGRFVKGSSSSKSSE